MDHPVPLQPRPTTRGKRLAALPPVSDTDTRGSGGPQQPTPKLPKKRLRHLHPDIALLVNTIAGTLDNTDGSAPHAAALAVVGTLRDAGYRFVRIL